MLALQAGEVPLDSPALFFLKWNGASVTSLSVNLHDYFPPEDFFEKITFAPVELRPVQ